MLIGFAVVFGIITYQFAITKTIEAYNHSKELSHKNEEAATAPAKVIGLTHKLSQLDDMVQLRQLDTAANVHDLLLGYVSNYSKQNKLIVKDFPEAISVQQQEFEIQTHKFALQGNFNQLLQLVYLLEQKQRLGKISSLCFQAAKDMDTKQTILIATVYLQNIKKIK